MVTQELDIALKDVKNRVSSSTIPFGIAKELVSRLDKLESILRSSVQESLAQSMRQQVRPLVHSFARVMNKSRPIRRAILNWVRLMRAEWTDVGGTGRRRRSLQNVRGGITGDPFGTAGHGQGQAVTDQSPPPRQG